MKPVDKAFKALLPLYFIWGTEYFLLKQLVAIVPAFFATFLITFFAGAIMFIYCLYKGEMKPTHTDIKNTFLTGFFFVFGGTGLIALASVYLDSSLVALLSGLSPTLVLLGEIFIMKGTKPKITGFAGIVMGFAGLIVLVLPAVGKNALISPKGVVLGLLSPVVWSIGMLVTKHASYSISLGAKNSLQLVLGSVCLLGAAAATGEFSLLNIDMFTAKVACLIVYVALASCVCGYSLYLWLLNNTPVSMPASTSYVCPLVAVLAGAKLGGESVTVYTIFALVSILLSVILITKKN